MIDFSQMKLGRGPRKIDARTMQFKNYLGAVLPTPPQTKNWGKIISPDNWGMMGNDVAGCCGPASIGHAVMNWTGNNNDLVMPTTAQVIEMYSGMTGYNPQTGANDTGVALLDLMNYSRKIGVAGKKTLSFAEVEASNQLHTKIAIDIFGCVVIGLNLPVSAQKQSLWDVPVGGAVGDGAPGSWGGHCVIVPAFSANYAGCITWGMTLNMTWNFWNTYVDEVFASDSNDWLKNGVAPNKYNIAQMTQDMQLLTAA